MSQAKKKPSGKRSSALTADVPPSKRERRPSNAAASPVPPSPTSSQPPEVGEELQKELSGSLDSEVQSGGHDNDPGGEELLPGESEVSARKEVPVDEHGFPLSKKDQENLSKEEIISHILRLLPKQKKLSSMFVDLTCLNKEIEQKDKIIDELLSKNAPLDTEVTIAQEEYADKKLRADAVRTELDTEKFKHEKCTEEIKRVEAEIAAAKAETDLIRNPLKPAQPKAAPPAIRRSSKEGFLKATGRKLEQQIEKISQKVGFKERRGSKDSSRSKGSKDSTGKDSLGSGVSLDTEEVEATVASAASLVEKSPLPAPPVVVPAPQPAPSAPKPQPPTLKVPTLGIALPNSPSTVSVQAPFGNVRTNTLALPPMNPSPRRPSFMQKGLQAVQGLMRRPSRAVQVEAGGKIVMPGSDEGETHGRERRNSFMRQNTLPAKLAAERSLPNSIESDENVDGA